MLLGRRSLLYRRADLRDVLAATRSKSAIELALNAGGLSLSDQLWYRELGSDVIWERSSPFGNAWDDAFGRSLLDRDYRSLAAASPGVPDATLTGGCIKAWVRTPAGPRLLKAPVFASRREVTSELVASRML